MAQSVKDRVYTAAERVSAEPAPDGLDGACRRGGE